MTLLEMSASYRRSAAAIHGRRVDLRGLERAVQLVGGQRAGGADRPLL